ncbi:fimbrial protein [Isoalcanivorax beigongshangi]|uniref:Fimbrial protein n=1 Tax=Isoalcanivorax beigongshangi TaxID=3238810 RepID=A0ABV4AN08_9GAMM
MNKSLLACAALPALLIAEGAWARCDVTNGYRYQDIDMRVGQVIVRPDAVIGQVLARKEFPINGSNNQVIVTCDRRGGSALGDMLQGQPAGTVSNTYTTDVPGIGIRLARRLNASGTTPAQDVYYPHNIALRSNDRRHLAQGYFTVEVIKIAENTGSGSLASGRYTNYYTEGTGPSRPLLTTSLTANAITIVSSACFVDAGSKNIAVNFDSMYRGRFTGVGSTHQTREFDVQLTCSGPSAGRDVVKLSFDYTPDPANVPGVIRLDGGAGSASGVGIQLLTANGEPIRQQQPLTVATLDTPDLRTVTVPLQARYYQTAPAVQAGDTQARATFTIEYN